MSAASEEQTPERSGTSRLRVLVAALVALEAALLVAGAVALLVNGISTDAVTNVPTGPATSGERTSIQDNSVALIALAAIALVLGAGLAFCARGVARGLRWTRGPVLTWQLLQAGVGMPLTTTGAWWAGVPLLAASIVAGVLIAGRHVITQSAERF